MEQSKNTYTGTTDPMETKREKDHRDLARKTAAEGMVLLKNEGVLPLQKDASIALYGMGAGKTIKGGTGSGDVNERASVSIFEGLQNAGIQIRNQDEVLDNIAIYDQAKLQWRDGIMEQAKGKSAIEYFFIYSENPFMLPLGKPITEDMVDPDDICIYVVSRVAGEGADRRQMPGDYELYEQERADIEILSKCAKHVVLIVNAGGPVNITAVSKLPHLDGILVISQPGMEGGNAVADLLTGAVTPSGKLTDTWSKAYEDYPNAPTFSHVNGNVETEYYEEGIYVGYRYFDSYQVEPLYGFGYGLSYTQFAITDVSISAKDQAIQISVKVTNTGDLYSGKQVVQVYMSAPQQARAREYRRLCAFAKTNELQPGQSELVTMQIDAKEFAAFDEAKGAWIVDPGTYGIWIGDSLMQAELAGAVQIAEEVVYEQVAHVCPLQEDLVERAPDRELMLQREAEWLDLLSSKQLPILAFAPKPATKPQRTISEFETRAAELVDRLTDEELIAMVIGEVSKAQESAIGSAGNMVPGAAGETSGILKDKYNIQGATMADGPAGLRLLKKYYVDPNTKEVLNCGLLSAMEGGMFDQVVPPQDAIAYYQYCTAFPVGTLLAQSWDTALVAKVGEAVATEMLLFDVAWWLAPGMNIHRNPLCGRNFEYYSEDPLLTGYIAAAITNGVQARPGVGTTIKHFACNNQEDNRMGTDSVISERALREIYLKGFEIAVKTSQPMAIMTSYNKINGVHAANSRDLCTVIARQEWGFEGLIMTDWTTTQPHGGSSSHGCILAGNDLIMPGYDGDFTDIREALANGSLSREALKQCVAHILNIVLQVQ